MSQVSTEICILGSIEPVFDLVTTTRHWPRWHPATEAVSGVTDRPLELGDQVAERAVIGGPAHAWTWTVAARERPWRLLLQIDAGRIEMAYTFTASDRDATLLRRELTYRPED